MNQELKHLQASCDKELWRNTVIEGLGVVKRQCDLTVKLVADEQLDEEEKKDYEAQEARFLEARKQVLAKCAPDDADLARMLTPNNIYSLYQS